MCVCVPETEKITVSEDEARASIAGGSRTTCNRAEEWRRRRSSRIWRMAGGERWCFASLERLLDELMFIITGTVA